MRTIFLISCTASKRDYSCIAEEMYKPSRFFRAAFQYALNRSDDKNEQIFILSAEYGLLSLSDYIDTYNVTLQDMTSRECAEWGESVFGSISRKFDVENTIFEFLTSNMYANPITKHLPRGNYDMPLKDINRFKRTAWLEQHALPSNGNQELLPAMASATLTLNKSNSNIPTTEDFKAELDNQFSMALADGKTSLTITSGELHRMVGGYPGQNHRMRTCCEVMYSSMRQDDVILDKPPKGKGATVKITYFFEIPNVNASASYVPKEIPSMISIRAHELRSNQNLQKVSGDKPGWYRWWTPTAALEYLLNSPHVTKKYMKELSPYMQRRKFEQADYFCVYVGVAIKESIRDRLNWHVNQRHTESAVRSGFLSTFRKTVSSLVAGNQYDESATNELIDQLIVEYCAMDYPIKSDAAKNEIERIEHNEMNKYVLPLNIKGNHHAILQSFLSDLKKARKLSSERK